EQAEQVHGRGSAHNPAAGASKRVSRTARADIHYVPMNGPGTLLAGKYQLDTVAGTGGMATVWRALQRGPAGFERSVGIKLIRAELAHDRGFVAMFVEEARVSSLLVHPNIVQVYDFGEEGGHYFLVMEWVDGLSLAHY